MYESLSIYTPRRRNTSFEATEEMENRFITNLAKEASINAIKDTFSRGIPVVTLINKSIVKIHPDGKTETLDRLKKYDSKDESWDKLLNDLMDENERSKLWSCNHWLHNTRRR